MSKLITIVGFLTLSLSPSFVDWEQSPELRQQMVAFYVVGIVLIMVGLDGWIKQ